MLDKKPKISFNKQVFYSSLSGRDLRNLKYLFNLSREQYLDFYERLTDDERLYLDALVYTHRYDMFDHAFDKDFELDPMVEELITRIKDKKDV